MLRKLALVCAAVAVLFVPTTPTSAGHGHGGHGHGGHGHWHGGHGHWRGGLARSWMGGWWGPSVGIAIAPGYYGRRCWDPYYGYYPCRYRWGY
jgi:hypothetical protein